MLVADGKRLHVKDDLAAAGCALAGPGGAAQKALEARLCTQRLPCQLFGDRSDGYGLELQLHFARNACLNNFGLVFKHAV